MRLAGGIFFLLYREENIADDGEWKKYKTKKNDDGRICKRKFFVKIADKPEYRWRIIIILLDGVRRYEGEINVRS